MQSQFALLPFLGCSVKGFFKKTGLSFPDFSHSGIDGNLNKSYHIHPLPDEPDRS
jgi:hypothetical protein